MNVLVDTPIWSEAFRRKKEGDGAGDSSFSAELNELIREVRAVMIGPVRQEILSGISSELQFKNLKEKLRAFDEFPILTEDYEMAATFYNTCRSNGVQGSHIDFLLCAVAYRNNMLIFTTDNDFEHYSKHIDISLYIPRVKSH